MKNINEYIDSDAKEVNFPTSLNSIYFWWWTPTSLSNEQLKTIIKTLENKFGLEKNIEITLETTINNITEENLLFWRVLWINRLSLWIQTLNNQTLKEIWRSSREEILEKLDIIKRDRSFFRKPVSGGNTFLAISLDFIIWLPYVKKWEVLKDIKFILEKFDFINHISLYMLEEYYDYPKKWQEVSVSEDDYLEEYLLCKNYLKEKWFKRYELSNFSKKWFDCNHNKAYWDHSNVIAFWLWSHGLLNWIRYAYPSNFRDYYSWKLEVNEKLWENDLFLEKIMFWLRTYWLEKEIYIQLNQEKIKYFIEQKLLNFQDNKLVLDDNWVTLIDYIIKEII